MDTFNPEYNLDSTTLKKFRFKARKGLFSLKRDERQAYGAAVEAAVLSAQRSQLRRAGVPLPAPNCASRTAHTTGEAISKAIREQHRAALQAHVVSVRRKRTHLEWQTMYDEAMAEKRQRQSSPQKQRRAA